MLARSWNNAVPVCLILLLSAGAAVAKDPVNQSTLGGIAIKGTDPKAWRIVDGKLYLNYSLEVQATWEADIPRFIRLADENYPIIFEKP